MVYRPPRFEDFAEGEVQGRALELAQKADRLVEAGIHDDALKLIREALDLWPNGDVLHMQEGSILLRSGKPQDALKAMRQAVDRDPQNSIFRTMLCQALEGTEQWAEALSQHEKAYQLGLAHVGRDPGAETAEQAFYRKCAGSKESVEDGLRGACFRIYPHLTEADLKAKFESLDREFKSTPQDRQVQIQLYAAYVFHGANLIRNGSYDEAISHFKRLRAICCQLEPAIPESTALNALAGAYARKGENDEALRIYGEALRQAENAVSRELQAIAKIRTLAQMAQTLFGMRNYGEAEMMIQKAVGVFDGHPELRSVRSDYLQELVTDTIGHLYLRWAECRRAAQDWEGALERNGKITEHDQDRQIEQAAQRTVILLEKGDRELAQKELQGFSDEKRDAVVRSLANWGVSVTP